MTKSKNSQFLAFFIQKTLVLLIHSKEFPRLSPIAKTHLKKGAFFAFISYMGASNGSKSLLLNDLHKSLSFAIIKY